MYTIYADGKLIHDPRLFQEGHGVISPKLTVEVSKAGSLEFTIPPNHALYDDIAKLKSFITVFQNGEELFRGRVLNDEKDFYKQKKTYCEGQLAFLLDSTQRPYSYSGTVEGLLKKFITNHNARVEADKQFKLGKVTTFKKDDGSTIDKISCSNYSYPNTFDEITEQIINTVGGHLLVRKEDDGYYIDLLAESTDDGTVNSSSQIIEFGVNLLDLTEYITAENIFTVLIPLGATLEDSDGNPTDEKLTISSVNDGKDYIQNDKAVSLFGRIEKSVEWSEVEEASELLTLGRELLAENIEMAVSLSVRAVDLHLLNVDVDQIHVGDWVTVISVPHGVNKQFQCTKITYDLLNPENNEYSFGSTYKSLTEQQVSDKKTMQSSVSMVVSTAGAVNSSVSKANQAASTMENVIVQLDTEYVKTTTFDAYKTEVAEDINDLNSKYQDLLARVITLEGGTA